MAHLNRVAVYDKIKNDDISIKNMLPIYTVARISDFIKVAAENAAFKVTAMHSKYKSKNFGTADIIEEFVLS